MEPKTPELLSHQQKPPSEHYPLHAYTRIHTHTHVRVHTSLGFLA